MSEKQTAKKRIPRFKSHAEEANFWDTHSPLDFEDEFVEVKLKVVQPLIHSLAINLDPKAIDALGKIGRAKGLGATTLAAEWILERLAAEGHPIESTPKSRARRRLQLVESTSIAEVGYDARHRELLIRFKPSGDLYLYRDVEAETYERLMAADSIGRFVNAKIKNHYEFEKLT
jgi:hypothetical protein